MPKTGRKLPRRRPGQQACMLVHPGGVKVYCNRQALRYLAEHLMALADSPEGHYREAHLIYDMESAASLADAKAGHDVWALFESALAPHFDKRSVDGPGFDVEFMCVERDDLDELKALENAGVVPDGYASGVGSGD